MILGVDTQINTHMHTYPHERFKLRNQAHTSLWLVWTWFKNSHCVFTEVQKPPQFMCQRKTVINNSLTPNVALSVPSSGILLPIVSLQSHINNASDSRPLFVAMPGVWLLCDVTYRISALAGFLQIQSQIHTYILVLTG